ncbi:MAG: PEP-CTERM sorting domain-containing protein [Sedimenticola sp.]
MFRKLLSLVFLATFAGNIHAITIFPPIINEPEGRLTYVMEDEDLLPYSVRLNNLGLECDWNDHANNTVINVGGVNLGDPQDSLFSRGSFGYEPYLDQWRINLTSTATYWVFYFDYDKSKIEFANAWRQSSGSILYEDKTEADFTYDAPVFRKVGQVPEPATLALMGLGLAGIGFARKKKAA